MNYKKILEKMQDLFQNPSAVWEKIEQEYVKSTFSILKDYFLIFYLLIPIAVTLKQFFVFKSIQILAYQGIILPAIAITTYLFVLYILSIVLEEAAEFMGGHAGSYAGVKLSFFSGLPFLCMVILSVIPYIGVFLALTGLIYQIALIYAGAETLLKIPAKRKWFWIFSIILSFGLLLFLFFLVAFIISILLNLI